MSKLTATIPFTKIKKTDIYVNYSKKSMSQIKKELGCDYLINAGLFNMKTFKPINRLVVNGQTLSDGKGMFGFSFSDDKVVLSYENQVNYPDHVSGYPCLLKSGKKAFTSDPSGLGGKRGRTAIGYGTHALVLFCCSDGSDAMTLDALQKEMRKLGCIDAINLDGGGSSQCNFDGKCITSSRTVHNYIAIWVKKDEVQNTVSTTAITQTTTVSSKITKTVCVKSVLNVRAKAPTALGTNTSKIVGKYGNGQKVVILETKYGWGRTDLGWVSMKYLR